MKSASAALIFLMMSSACFAQSFIIDDAESFADFDIRKNESHLTCFYKALSTVPNSSYYRTLGFNANFDLTDTVGYKIAGTCNNLGSGETGTFIYHVFYASLPAKKEAITFLVTDKFGKVVATYDKTLADFVPVFGKKVKKLSRIQFKFIATEGNDSGILLIEPSLYTGSGALKMPGKLMAMDLISGKIIWQFPAFKNRINAKAIQGKLISLEQSDAGALAINTYSLSNGQQQATTLVNPRNRNRVISIFEVDSTGTVLAGSDAEQNDESNKHNRFYLTRYDLSGNLIFDKVDTVERLSGNRLLLLGGAFKPDGDLILVGESYKKDATAMIAGTAASIALSVLLGSPTGVTPVGRVQHIIQGIITARISPLGDVMEFHVFPADKRSEFSTIMMDSHQIFLHNKNQLLLYDFSDLSSPPRKFNTVTNEQQIIVFAGNLIGIRKDDQKKEIILENIPAK